MNIFSMLLIFRKIGVFFSIGYQQTFSLRLYIPSLSEIAGSLQCKDFIRCVVVFCDTYGCTVFSDYLN